jgi:hypothetical protein
MQPISAVSRFNEEGLADRLVTTADATVVVGATAGAAIATTGTTARLARAAAT